MQVLHHKLVFLGLKSNTSRILGNRLTYTATQGTPHDSTHNILLCAVVAVGMTATEVSVHWAWLEATLVPVLANFDCAADAHDFVRCKVESLVTNASLEENARPAATGARDRSRVCECVQVSRHQRQPRGDPLWWSSDARHDLCLQGRDKSVSPKMKC